MSTIKEAITIKSAISRLEAYHDCNHEYMDADDLGDLEVTLKDLKEMYNKLVGARTQTYEAYAAENDTTFIMEETLVNNEVIKLECIGWYCGEPNAEDTKKYGDRNYTAMYV